MNESPPIRLVSTNPPPAHAYETCPCVCGGGARRVHHGLQEVLDGLRAARGSGAHCEGSPGTQKSPTGQTASQSGRAFIHTPMTKYISSPPSSPPPSAMVSLQSGHSQALGTAMADRPLHGGETRAHGVARWQILPCHHQHPLRLYQHDLTSGTSSPTGRRVTENTGGIPSSDFPSGPSVFL